MFARGEEVKVVVMNGAVLGEVFRGRYVETKEGFIVLKEAISTFPLKQLFDKVAIKATYACSDNMPLNADIEKVIKEFKNHDDGSK